MMFPSRYALYLRLVDLAPEGWIQGKRGPKKVHEGLSMVSVDAEVQEPWRPREMRGNGRDVRRMMLAPKRLDLLFVESVEAHGSPEILPLAMAHERGDPGLRVPIV